ncbi:MAG: tyrosine decarboxylase MfnA, partial [Methanosphaera sp.]|nr:tyrosine decarboxylase MfnA [Methanosphaera sp.]
MQQKRKSKDEVFNDLRKYHSQDMSYSSGKILGSMCTHPDPIGIEAYNMFLDTNLGDPGLFKGTSMMEEEVIKSIGNLLHLDDASGHIVTGGTEANIMAITVAKYLYQEKDNEGKPELILPKTSHFSFNKIIRMLDIKPVYVPLTSEYKIDTSKLEDLINENTMAIVAIAGTTELGLIDDIPKISDIAYSHGVYLHVDAALGGFMIPFMNIGKENPTRFDFELRGVSSITIDPHKMGLAPIPSGGIIFRKKEYLEKLAIKTPYLTKDNQTTIVGTRTGASTAATWTLLNYYGIEGYKQIGDNVISLTDYTYKQLLDIPCIKLIHKPELNVLAFITDVMDVESLHDKLLGYGWEVSIGENPHAIRIVLMPHVKRENIDAFLVDLKTV